MTKDDAILKRLVLEYLHERHKQGDVRVCLADVFESFGLTPDVSSYDTYYELTERFFSEQEAIFAQFDAAQETQH